MVWTTLSPWYRAYVYSGVESSVAGTDSWVMSTLIWPLSPKQAISVDNPASAIINSVGSTIVKLFVVVQSLASVIVTLYVPADKSVKSWVVALYESSPVLVQA